MNSNICVFQEFMGEESTIEKLFKSMDKNGDGVVTKEVENIKSIYIKLKSLFVCLFVFSLK